MSDESRTTDEPLAGYVHLWCGHYVDPKWVPEKPVPGKTEATCPTCGRTGVVAGFWGDANETAARIVRETAERAD